MLLRGKFTEPKSSVEQKEDIREEMFPLAGFVNQACSLSDYHSCSSSDLFKGYLIYCNAESIKYRMSAIKFTKMLKNSDLNLRCDRKMIDGVRVQHFYGIRLKEDILEMISLNSNNQFVNRISNEGK